MNPLNQKKPVKTALKSTAIVVLTAGLTFGLAACSGNEHDEEHGEVLAVDRVDEAAEIARANAPEAEVVELETVQTAPAETETDATEDMTDLDSDLDGDIAQDGSDESDNDDLDTANTEQDILDESVSNDADVVEGVADVEGTV